MHYLNLYLLFCLSVCFSSSFHIYPNPHSSSRSPPPPNKTTTEFPCHTAPQGAPKHRHAKRGAVVGQHNPGSHSRQTLCCGCSCRCRSGQCTPLSGVSRATPAPPLPCTRKALSEHSPPLSGFELCVGEGVKGARGARAKAPGGHCRHPRRHPSGARGGLGWGVVCTVHVWFGLSVPQHCPTVVRSPPPPFVRAMPSSEGRTVRCTHAVPALCKRRLYWTGFP